MGIGDGPPVAESTDGTRGDEPDEDLTETLVAHADASAELWASEWCVGHGERGQDDLIGRGRLGRLAARVRVRIDLEMGLLVAGKCEGDGFGGRRTAMLGDAWPEKNESPTSVPSHPGCLNLVRGLSHTQRYVTGAKPGESSGSAWPWDQLWASSSPPSIAEKVA
jgi:hypothetical protein